MNKDLDERLLPQGHYRDALNIQVTTTDGSDVGVVQTIYGNKKIESYSADDQVNATVNRAEDNSKVVGSIADDKTNSCYFFIASPQWSNNLYGDEDKVFKDMIIKYDSTDKKLYPVVTDVIRIETPNNAGWIRSTEDFDYLEYDSNILFETLSEDNLSFTPVFDVRNVRPGMIVEARNIVNGSTNTLTSVGSYNETNTPIIVEKVVENRIYFNRTIKVDAFGGNVFDSITTWNFTNPRPVLQFNEGLTANSNYYISGINIIDDLLLWTDGYSEPKKINVSRFPHKGVSEKLRASFNLHSLNLIKNVYGNNPNSLKLISEVEDPQGVGVNIDDRLNRDDITVIKKAPKYAPKLIMSNSYSSLDGVAVTANCSHDFVGVYESDVVQGISFSESFVQGSVLVFTPLANAFASIRAVITSANLVTNNYSLEIQSISSLLTNAPVGEYIDYKVALVQPDAMFKDKIGRFSYRYKYYDGEYSTFAPFSEIAFVPSKYDYLPSKGYNTGMSNNIRSLRVTDFVNDYVTRPGDVKEIDILFKDTTSPNIYIVKTIKRGKNLEWFNNLGPATGFDGAGAKGVLDITSDMIHRTLEESQALRSWDNVPITAKAQEVSGNRVVYANYEQGYDINRAVVVDAQCISTKHPGVFDENLRLSPIKSLKSIRKYKLGVVFGDAYGRETPVVGVGGLIAEDFEMDPDTLETSFTSENYVPETFEVKKDKSYKVNKIKAKLNWSNGNYGSGPEEWMSYYKFYIKETSNEYYNLVMDRWYDNTDNTVWLSFVSADRNKVQEGDYLILKKAHDSQQPIVSDDAKYKILSISNEAPDYIKTIDKVIGVSPLDMTGNLNLSDLLSAQIVGDSWLGSGLGAIASGTKSFEGVGWARIKGVSSGATPSEVLYSEWRRISNINQEASSISVTEPWGPQADMQSDFGFGIGASVDFFVEVKDSVIENRPEFNGKFFVKIYKDDILQNNVTLQSNDDIVYIPEKISEVGYIYTGSGLAQGYNPADSSALYKGDYSTIATPTPTNGVDDRTDYIWNYTGFTGTSNTTGVLGMYSQANLMNCNITNASGISVYDHSIIRDYWEDYWTGATYGIATANRWFIDHADFAKPPQFAGSEWEGEFNQGIFHTSAEEFATMIAFIGFIDSATNNNLLSNFNIDVSPGSLTSAGVMPQNKNSIIFSHVGSEESGYGVVDQEFKEKMTTIGQKFRFKSDPGLEGDPIVYEVFGAILSSDRVSYKGQGVFQPGDDTDAYCQGCEESESLACKRSSFVVFFKQADNDYQGLDTSVWDPRSSVKHDGSDSLKIELVKAVDTSQYIDTVNNIGNAIFETQPAEDVGLDLYYEASEAIPMELNSETIESYVPLYSKVTAFNTNNSSASSSYQGMNYIQKPENIYVNSVTKDVIGLGTQEGIIFPIPIRINDTLEFSRPDGTKTQSVVTKFFEPTTKTSNGTYSYIPATVQQNIKFVVTPGSFETRKVIVPRTTEVDQDQAEIVEEILRCFSDQRECIWKVSDSTINIISTLDVYVTNAVESTSGIDGIELDFIWVVPSSILLEEYDQQGDPFDSDLIPESDAEQTHSFTLSKVTGYYQLQKETHSNPVVLSWSNCYSFGNGLESNRINDDYNAPYIDNGVKVSTTLDTYGKEFRTNGLIHSGIYNSTSGVNKLNEFNMAESITKDVNPSYGPIRILKSRDTNLVTFCEDKIVQILADKDALYDAEGNASIVDSYKVLGSTRAFSGDYGISDNPESLAVDGYRMYFVDKHRNKVLRLSQDGLTVISDIGMKNWFRDNLLDSNFILGSFDTVKGDYNVTISYNSSAKDSTTVTFNEKNKGWTSFKSFTPVDGISINADYLTALDSDIYLHHVYEAGVNPGQFYGEKTDSSITMIFNDQPTVVKSFKAIEYEGTQAAIQKFTTESVSDVNGNIISTEGLNSAVSDNEYYNLSFKNGWSVKYIKTNLEEADVIDFKEKEGKWFSNLTGKSLDFVSGFGVESSNFTIQGIGIAKKVEAGGVITGCTDPCASNYNDQANVDDGSCILPVFGCMDPSYQEYNSNATVQYVSCDDHSNPCVNLHTYGCNMSLGSYSFSTATTPQAEQDLITQDDGSCIEQILGCTNPAATNFNPLANTDDGSCTLPALGCDDPEADNYDPDATHRANGYGDGVFEGNPCEYTHCGNQNALLVSSQFGEVFGLGGYLTIAEWKESKNVVWANSEGIDITYSATFIADDSLCVMPVEGCTDLSASNYNPEATIDDGSCVYEFGTTITFNEV